VHFAHLLGSDSSTKQFVKVQTAVRSSHDQTMQSVGTIFCMSGARISRGIPINISSFLTRAEVDKFPQGFVFIGFNNFEPWRDS
jgi:hypothetical protein